jgi:hypothetical protein
VCGWDMWLSCDSCKDAVDISRVESFEGVTHTGAITQIAKMPRAVNIRFVLSSMRFTGRIPHAQRKHMLRTTIDRFAAAN